jgi:hypothetical protein
VGLRAIPAQRLLAAHARNLGAQFFSAPEFSGDKGLNLDPIMVFSPSMFLPAIIAKAESLAKFVFESADMLGVRREINHRCVLGVEADVLAVDGSPEGVLRSLLLTRASEQVFEFNADLRQQHVVDVNRVRNYYLTEGAQAIRGERDDSLSVEVLSCQLPGLKAEVSRAF